MLIGLATVVLGAATVILAGAALSAVTPGDASGASEALANPVPAAAANLPRLDGVPDRDLNRPLIKPYESRFQSAIGGPRTGYLNGLYGMPGLADPVTDGVAWVMYVGHNMPRQIGDPAVMVSRLMRAFGGGAPSWPAAPGLAGGSARCMHAYLAGTQLAICGWATARTIGAVMSPARDASIPELATLMRLMRPDLAGIARPVSFP